MDGEAAVVCTHTDSPPGCFSIDKEYILEADLLPFFSPFNLIKWFRLI